MLPARSDISDVATYESRREWLRFLCVQSASGLTATVTAIAVNESNMTQSLAIEFTTLNYGEILRRRLVAPLFFHARGASVAVSSRWPLRKGRRIFWAARR